MHFHRSSLALIAVLVLAAGGCAPTIDQDTSATPRAQEKAPQLRVKNFSWSDIRLYAVRSGVRFRIGIISSMGEQSFKIPESVTSGASGFTLLADPIPSGYGFMTESIQVSSGQSIELTLENNLNLSSYAVW